MQQVRNQIELAHQLQVQKLKGRNDVLEKQSKQNLDQVLKLKERITHLEQSLAEERIKKKKIAGKYKGNEDKSKKFETLYEQLNIKYTNTLAELTRLRSAELGYASLEGKYKILENSEENLKIIEKYQREIEEMRISYENQLNIKEDLMQKMSSDYENLLLDKDRML